MEKYELLYLLPAKHTEAEMETIAEKIKGIISATGAGAVEQHHLGRRKLAYPVKNFRNGNYFLVRFEAEAPAITKLNDAFRLSSDILRHLIIHHDPRLTRIPSFIEEETPRREREEEQRRPEKPAAPIQQAPLQPSKDKMSMAELDKKLDEMLTDDVM